MIENKNAYYMYETEKYFYIKASQQIFSKSRTIKINRQTGKISEINEIKNEEFYFILNFSLILGIVIIKGQPFLLLVTQSKQIAKIYENSIQKIQNIEFIHFSTNFNKKTQNYEMIMQYITCMKDDIFKDNFYFSYTLDLTLNHQNLFKQSKSQPKFYWNQFLLTSFINGSVSKCFIIPIIQGFIQNYHFQKFSYILISRRSKFMSGTRFNCRGVDDDGNVANFVQTEQIFLTKKLLASYIQIRGSIPLYWKQNSKTLDVSIYNPQKNIKVIQKHYQNLQKIYGPTCTINLLGKKKARQRDLTEAFRDYFNRIKLKNHHYQHFDISEFIKSQSSIQKGLDNYINNQKIFVQDYFLINVQKKQIIKTQKSFNRINCLDCQDRTNALMSKISGKMSKIIIENLEISKQILEKFEILHKNAWVQNGQKISMIYSGTGSVATYITQGVESASWTQSLSNLFIEAKRMYIANTNDSHKQESINIILGLGFESATNYFIKQQQDSFSSNEQVVNYQFN